MLAQSAQAERMFHVFLLAPTEQMPGHIEFGSVLPQNKLDASTPSMPRKIK